MKEIEFHMRHGKNTSDRIEKDLIDIIQTILVSSECTWKGQKLTFKRFGKSGIDVSGIEGFDHIEITMKKTGWGCMINIPIKEQIQ